MQVDRDIVVSFLICAKLFLQNQSRLDFVVMIIITTKNFKKSVKINEHSKRYKIKREKLENAHYFVKHGVLVWCIQKLKI